MASTSLRRQVEALRHASSGTSSGYIQRKKGKPSLLLTPDQAADVDLASVRESAVMGLQRLEAVDSNFSSFQSTLFSKEAETTLRDLQTKDVNQRIDKSVTSFLALISPHFSSREAHLCLEYLIRHYKIYQYNVDAVVECCLPWHDTVAFARMVQLLSIKGTKWDFLEPVQKTGSPLPREAIARRCARDHGLLRFLCAAARRASAASASAGGSLLVGQEKRATKEPAVSSATASGRSKLFSFYAAAVIEALESLNSTNESLLRALLPEVVHGLSATRSPEYQMSSYMILAALATKGPLSSEVTSVALSALTCKPCQRGLEPPLLCAIAVVQTQVGFASRNDPSSNTDTIAGSSLALPISAFEKLSSTESLPRVLAGLSEKFDASAFLGLLLQTYVEHLSDKDGENHAASLVRLCTYSRWPALSIQRAIKKLVDRLVKSCVTVAYEAEDAPNGSDDAADKKRKAEMSTTQTTRILRALSQRYPEEVDWALSKVSRYLRKSASAAAAVTKDGEGGGKRSALEVAKSREASFREAALSSVLASTFAVAELAHHMPLQVNASVAANQRPSAAHSSMVVALEHPSGDVRARALEQLAHSLRRVSSDGKNTEPPVAPSAVAEDLVQAILRRLYDQDSKVVLVITDNDVFLTDVLLSSLHRVTHRIGDDVEVPGRLTSTTTTSTEDVVHAAATAATRWLAALCHPRPKHSRAESSRALTGLLRLACGAVLSGARSPPDTPSTTPTPTVGSGAMKALLRLIFECLPGPHVNAQVKRAAAAAAKASSSSSGGTGDETVVESLKDDQNGKKKSLRAVARAAIAALLALKGENAPTLLRRVIEILDEKYGGDVVVEGRGADDGKGQARRKMVDGEEKLNTLTAMGRNVCAALGNAFAVGEIEGLEELAKSCGPGGRWLLMDGIARAIPIATEASGDHGRDNGARTVKLSSLLASLAVSELNLSVTSTSSPSPPGVAVSADAAAALPTDVLAYLPVCAAHLSCSSRPLSLFAADHLSEFSDVASVGVEGVTARSDAPFVAPMLGDVLLAMLRSSLMVDDNKRSDQATGAVGNKSNTGASRTAIADAICHSVVLQKRPLFLLAALALSGITSPSARGDRDEGGAQVATAARALCIAATLIRASAEARKASAGEVVGESVTPEDVVAVFPASIVAITSESKAVRDAGILFINTVTQHGHSLKAPISSGKSTPFRGKSKKSASLLTDPISGSDIFPPFVAETSGTVDRAASVTPSPILLPDLSEVVALAGSSSGKNSEWGMTDVGRHLAVALGEGHGMATPSKRAPVSKLDASSKHALTGYLVSWAARLAWRNATAALPLLECLHWAGSTLRESCLRLLRHSLDDGGARINTRLLHFLFGVALCPSSSAVPTYLAVSSAVAVDDPSTRAATTAVSPKKKRRRQGQIEETSTAAGGNSTISVNSIRGRTPTPLSAEAEALLYRALRMPGPIQALALEAVARCDSGVGATDNQKSSLLRALVDAALQGADVNLIAAAAKALPTLPVDVAAFVVELVSGEYDAGRNHEKRSRSRATATSPTGSGNWVPRLGGLLELVQSLLTPQLVTGQLNAHTQSPGDPRRSKAGSPNVNVAVLASQEESSEMPTKGWGGLASSALTCPLFDAIPALFAITGGARESQAIAPDAENAHGADDLEPSGNNDVDLAAAEYALWLTMDVLAGILKRCAAKRFRGVGWGYVEGRAAEDAEKVLDCIKGDPSPQTRNSALALLSALAALYPAAMASRLQSLLEAVAAAAELGGQASLRQTQAAVQSVLPALRSHGAEVGVGAHFVVQVFVEALEDAPTHTRRALFGTLVDAMGEHSLAIMASLLLQRASRPSDASGLPPHDDGGTSALIQFVHQMCHVSGAQAQVTTLVSLVQACHRLAANTAESAGEISGAPLAEAVNPFATTPANNCDVRSDRLDYMMLPLEEDGDTATGAPSSKSVPAFMTLDLKALAPRSSADHAEHGALAGGTNVGQFLETMLVFVRDHLTSKPLLMSVAAEAQGGDAHAEDGVQEGFLLLCEELLLLSRTLTACQQGKVSSRSPRQPSWKNVQALTYSVFETLQSLLSVPSFVAVTQELLEHQDPHLRRGALQMFTHRLDPASHTRPRFTPGEELLFIDMLPPLRRVAMGQAASPPVADDDMVDDEDEASLACTQARAAESVVNRQTAMLSMDVLARVLGRKYQSAFVGVLDDVTQIVTGTGPGTLPAVGESRSDVNLPLRSTAFLLLATLCAVLGVRAFPHFPRFFPAMLAALEWLPQSPTPGSGAASPSTDNRSGGSGQGMLWSSALSAVATVAASLPSFLSPHLSRIVAIALRPAAAAGVATAARKQAADRLLSLVAAGVEPRLLVPAICGAYDGCVKVVEVAGEEGDGASRAARLVARLLTYLQEILAGLEREGASAALPQITRLLTRSLDFRRLHASASSVAARAGVDMVEAEASFAIVALVMKLSEMELRPIFLHLCEWKAAGFGEGVEATLSQLDRRLSFYRVLDGLSSSLRSIFTPYFAHVLTDCCEDLEAASLMAQTSNLQATNDFNVVISTTSAKRKRRAIGKTRGGGKASKDDGQEEDDAAAGSPALRWRRSAAARLVLSALRRCFQFDRTGFVDKARFELLMPAVVSQLECGADYVSVTEASGKQLGSSARGSSPSGEVFCSRLHAEELVGPCLAQLASACAKEALWKALANAVLMRTRSRRAGVRVAALVALRQCFEVVGEEFLALLPECLPFLSELLEDDHPEVEGECRQLVKYIEGILGESIENFLS